MSDFRIESSEDRRARYMRLARAASEAAAKTPLPGAKEMYVRLAQAWVEVELLRLIGYRSLTRLLRTGQPGLESSIEKVSGSETDQRLQELAMEVLGPQAMLVGDRLRSYLYSRSETIMGGTSEIQRNVIAQRILGLPR